MGFGTDEFLPIFNTEGMEKKKEIVVFLWN